MPGCPQSTAWSAPSTSLRPFGGRRGALLGGLEGPAAGRPGPMQIDRFGFAVWVGRQSGLPRVLGTRTNGRLA